MEPRGGGESEEGVGKMNGGWWMGRRGLGRLREEGGG